MPKYILKGDYPLKVGGKHRHPGETVELDAAAAAPLVERGRLMPGSAGAAPPQPPESAPESHAAETEPRKGKGFFGKGSKDEKK